MARVTDMATPLFAKMKARAEAEHAQAAERAKTQRQADTLAVVLPPAPPTKISQGRPRKAYTAANSAPNALKMIAAFADAHLTENRDSCAYIGGLPSGTRVTLQNGKTARVPVEYKLPNLRDVYREFGRQQGYPKVPHKYFSGQLLFELTRRGWAVSIARSHRQRRHILQGVCLNGTFFDGNDAYL